MKTFVHAFAAKVTDDEVMANKAFPLVRELAHKYKLLVLAKRGDELYMARKDGIPVCKVFFYEDKESYAIRNCMKEKDRGRSREDKLTFFGKKVSFVMKIIEKYGLIPKDTTAFINKTSEYLIKGAVDNLSSSYGEIRKSVSMSGDIMHDLIEIALGNRHVSTLSVESMTKVQSALDKCRAADNTRAERQRELSEIFGSPMWVILYDNTDSFCIGKMKLSPTWNGVGDTTPASLSIEIVEDFHRVADLTEVAELIPTMAMLKTSIEQARPDIKYDFVGKSGFFPRNWSNVSPELRVMTIDCSNSWSSNWLLEPRMIMVAT